jgi:hypothetical protein
MTDLCAEDATPLYSGIDPCFIPQWVGNAGAGLERTGASFE